MYSLYASRHFYLSEKYTMPGIPDVVNSATSSLRHFAETRSLGMKMVSLITLLCILQWADEYGTNYEMWLGPFAKLVVTADPEVIKKVFVSRPQRFPRQKAFNQALLDVGLRTVANVGSFRQKFCKTTKFWNTLHHTLQPLLLLLNLI
jgi:hypothetical protein